MTNNIFPRLSHLELATDLAKAVRDAPADTTLTKEDIEDVCSVLLSLRAFVEYIHTQAVDPSVSGADFFDNVTSTMEEAGIGETWRGHKLVTRPAPYRSPFLPEPGTIVLDD